MKFVADTMLGKLARWLRILGYDTVYNSSALLKALIELSNNKGAIFLTKRKSFPNGTTPPTTVYFVRGERFAEQFRCVVEHFNLTASMTIFSRCLKCNVPVRSVEKQAVEGRVPPRSLEGFDTFYECPECLAVYWNGAHYANTLRKLQTMINISLKGIEHGT